MPEFYRNQVAVEFDLNSALKSFPHTIDLKIAFTQQ
jgi:hypothetical protein